jgi:DNA polymerase
MRYWPDYVFLQQGNYTTKSVDQKCYTKSEQKNDSSSVYTKLEELKKEFLSCRNNSMFDQFSNKLVLSDGNPESGLMFVGEAPGEQEDIEGKPFVGRSGQLLTRFLEDLELNRNQYYITNVIPWRPPNNRTPASTEIDVVKSMLFKHIEIISPKLIVAIGAVATKIFDIQSNISDAQGNIFETPYGKVFCIFHPSYALRAPMKKKDLWISLLRLKLILQKM